MHTEVELIGERFGRLVVKSKNPRRKTDAAYHYYDCECDCGNMAKHVRSDALREGKTRSCGCLRRETSIKMGGNRIRTPDGRIMR